MYFVSPKEIKMTTNHIFKVAQIAVNGVSRFSNIPRRMSPEPRLSPHNPCTSLPPPPPLCGIVPKGLKSELGIRRIFCSCAKLQTIYPRKKKLKILVGNFFLEIALFGPVTQSFSPARGERLRDELYEARKFPVD